MADKVITGVLINLQARSHLGTFTIGRAMSLRISEQYGVRPVYGIGALNAQELPVLQYAGGMTLQQFAIDAQAAETLLAQYRRQGGTGVPDVQSFIKQVLYNDGIDVTVSRRRKTVSATSQQPVPQDETVSYLKITNAVCTGEETSITENEVVIRSGSFVFANPVSV